MKKLKPVILAVIVGCACAYLLFKKVEDVSLLRENGNAVAVQIGAFTRKENAVSMSKKYGGIVTNDDGIYRVYYSILSKKDNLNFIENYLKSNGINYYLKRITLTDEMLDTCNKYEELMNKTSKESKLAVNNQLLKIYEADV